MTTTKWMTILAYVGIVATPFAAFAADRLEGQGLGGAIAAVMALKGVALAAFAISSLAVGYALSDIRETRQLHKPVQLAWPIAAVFAFLLLLMVSVRLWLY
jgi:hypothetical protein